MAQAQDVVYYFDDQGRACVDICAKALDILDGDEPNCWKYEVAERRGNFVHYAEMLNGTRLEVQGQHSPVRNLTPNTRYKVMFELSLKGDACGFKRPVTFQFTDQDGNKKDFTYQLNGAGTMKVLLGQFVSVAGNTSRNVKVKMSNLDSYEKSGLIVRCVTITPADN